MIKFILNDKEVTTELPAGTVLLDFIRYNKNLTGTKIGCREGDCGACTILSGELIGEELRYRSVTSCITPIGNADGKHIVTIEGLNMEGLNPIQQAMSNAGATQCGFCTVGFVVSLAGFCLRKDSHTYKNAIAAIDGNICRCTGYKSIERAAKKVADFMRKNKDREPVVFVSENKILPEYFAGIKKRLQKLSECTKTVSFPTNQPVNSSTHQLMVGGGTDLYVQKHDVMPYTEINLTMSDPTLNGISFENNECKMGSAITVCDLMDSEKFNKYFPDFKQYVKLISSTPIRNLATIGGNIINASPIGDFTIFFLALGAKLQLNNGKTVREIFLKDFYKGYKILDKKENEFLETITFPLPDKNILFNFEKVSKRTNLDIASVNTAICIKMENNLIADAAVSAGGVSPIPLYLAKSSAFLKNKEVTLEIIDEVAQITQSAISPISDTRGSSDYKRLLLRQLLFAHFSKLFSHIKIEKTLR